MVKILRHTLKLLKRPMVDLSVSVLELRTDAFKRCSDLASPEWQM